MKILNWKSQCISVQVPLVYLHGLFGVDEESPEFVQCEDQTWPVVDDEFKLFAFVKPGRNIIQVKWHNSKVYQVAVEYVKQANKRFIQPVYIICKNSDGSFMAPEGTENTLEKAIKNIQFNIRLMQVFFQESLLENGFERRSFYVPDDEKGEPDVKVLISDLEIDETMSMGPDDLYAYFHKEMNEKLGTDLLCKYLCFMSCTRYFPPEDEETFTVAKIMSYARGHAALGGGRLALFGTGSLHTWASSLDDLTSCFQNKIKIDRKKMFDDSCGRGTYWANYSTTLGATIHELGHCFDLAHTKHGIMCRGHDDMNHFYTVVKGESREKCSSQLQITDDSSKNTSKCIDDDGQYKGAHWYRSSAVLLNYHRWLNPSAIDETKDDTGLKVSLRTDLLGPFGSTSPFGSENSSFNSRRWLTENKLTSLVGLVFYYDTYLEGIQFQGVKISAETEEASESCQGNIVESQIYGKVSKDSKKLSFPLRENEHIECIQLRCGAWMDGVQLTTNLKSSPWMGGSGGNLHRINIPNGQHVDGLIGTAHSYVGSIGILLKSNDATPPPKTNPNMVTFSSKHFVRLVEIYDPKNGEVTWYKEFENPSDQQVQLDLQSVMNEKCYQNLQGTVWDGEGRNCRFTFGERLFKLLDSTHEEHQKV